jgi:hypothetical protein
MKAAWIVAVLVCVALASGAWAQLQFTPRSLGMGTASVGVADDGGAWFENPAGLGALDVKCPAGMSYAGDVIGGYGHFSDGNATGLLTASAWDPTRQMGVGAGWGVIRDVGYDIGAGFGMAVGHSPLCLGANVMRMAPTSSAASTALNIGALYLFPQPSAGPIRLGVVAADVTNSSGNGVLWNAGVAWPASPQVLVALDVLDVGDKMNRAFNGGVEFNSGVWAARAGMVDDGSGHDLTLGLGIALGTNGRADLAWVNSEPSSTWMVGAGVNF